MQIYCDMDQVLTNFLGTAEKILGKSFSDPSMTDTQRWEILAKHPTFWEDLKWMNEGKKLWKVIKKHKPYILTAISDFHPMCVPGKKRWVKQNLGSVWVKRALCVRRREKMHYATAKGKPNILIDDYIRNILEWRGNGGIGIQFTTASKALKELKEVGIQ